MTHTALQDLITFIYCGEVNVKNEALSTFISTAESLQIKGLTDSDTVKSESAEIVPAQIVINQAPVPVATRTVQRQPRQRPVVVEKLESEDSAAEERTPVTVAGKRAAPAPKSGTVKRAKGLVTSTPSGAQATSKQARSAPVISVKTTTTTDDVMIELPMDPIAVAEEQPSHVETIETEEPLVEEEEQEYEMKYDDSYFTEPEETKANLTSGSSFQDQTTTADAQGLARLKKASRPVWEKAGGRRRGEKKKPQSQPRRSLEQLADAQIAELNQAKITFREGQRGSRLLEVDGYAYVRNRVLDNKTYWICARKVR